MSSDWIKMRVDLLKHPKVVRMMSALKADNFRIVGGLLSAWGVFDAHSEDGRLTGYTLDALDMMAAWPGFSAAMVAVEWLVVEPDGLSLPRFDTHNGQSAKRRAQDADRKREVRNPSASDADKKRTREEKRREENNKEQKQERGETENPPAIVPPAAAADAAPSVIDLTLAVLKAGGLEGPGARTAAGKLRQIAQGQCGGSEAAGDLLLIQLFGELKTEPKADPIGWIRKALTTRGQNGQRAGPKNGHPASISTPISTNPADYFGVSTWPEENEQDRI